MNIITYTKRVPVMKAILGYALTLLGVISFLSGNLILSFILIGIGINLIATTGSEINLTNKMYRTIWTVFSIKLGNWKPCPEFEYVSVFRTNENQTVNAAAASATFSSEIILLNLFYGNKHITFYKTDNKTDAFKVAEHFKYALKVDILDATEKEKVWL